MPYMTPEQVAAHQAKHFPRTRPEHSSGPTGSERDLQNEIIKCCLSNQWPVFRGSMAHRTFRNVGEPDFHIIIPWNQHLMIECKSRKGKLTTEQLGVRMQLEMVGCPVHVVRSLSEFLELVQATITKR